MEQHRHPGRLPSHQHLWQVFNIGVEVLRVPRIAWPIRLLLATYRSLRVQIKQIPYVPESFHAVPYTPRLTCILSHSRGPHSISPT